MTTELFKCAISPGSVLFHPASVLFILLQALLVFPQYLLWRIFTVLSMEL